MAFNWTCPHCGTPQTVTDNKVASGEWSIPIDGLAEGQVTEVVKVIGCSNPDCMKLTLSVVVQEGFKDQYGQRKSKWDGNILYSRQLIPESSAKPQPEYIPAQLREDYAEACLVRELSPKSSATLARRCLQGMIRDFCKISKRRLVDEIDALRTTVEEGKAPAGVTPESVDAIDHVRHVGNIGAHMEADVNIIVEVEPDEAGILIELVELLFDEWYKAQHKREERLARVAKVAADKKRQLADAKAAIENDPAGTANTAA